MTPAHVTTSPVTRPTTAHSSVSSYTVSVQMVRTGYVEGDGVFVPGLCSTHKSTAT